MKGKQTTIQLRFYKSELKGIVVGFVSTLILYGWYEMLRAIL